MEQENKIQNKSVETYAEDMAEVIESSEGGLIKKIIHEQEEKEKEDKNLNPESKRNKVFMFLSVLLTLLALTALGFLITFRKNISTVPLESQLNPIIFTDKTTYIEVGGLKKDEISNSVWNESNTTLVKVGGLEAIYLMENKKIIGFKQLSTILESNIPPSLIPFIDDNFLICVLNGKETKDLFFLLKMSSFSDIFSPMLAWEKKLLFDLHGFFGIAVTADTNYLFNKDFEDGIVENKNARILYDNNRNIVMMYVFADDHSLVIANTEAAAAESMIRLSASRAKK